MILVDLLIPIAVLSAEQFEIENMCISSVKGSHQSGVAGVLVFPTVFATEYTPFGPVSGSKDTNDCTKIFDIPEESCRTTNDIGCWHFTRRS